MNTLTKDDITNVAQMLMGRAPEQLTAREQHHVRRLLQTLRPLVAFVYVEEASRKPVSVCATVEGDQRAVRELLRQRAASSRHIVESRIPKAVKGGSH